MSPTSALLVRDVRSAVGTLCRHSSLVAARCSQLRVTVNPLRKLYCKLCRELAQSERSAVVHTRREARRLGGDTPPARALRTLGGHAIAMRPRFHELVERRQPVGTMVGRRFGDVFSTLRHYLFDRLIDVERSYRGTLLGFHHGLSCARLLRDVADRLDEQEMVGFLDDWLRERIPLVESAERQLRYFAEAPRKAIRSGLRIAFEPTPE
jgi:hypothetical protein